MADFWGTLGNVFGNITGVNQANRAAEQSQAGQSNQNNAGQALGNAANLSAGQFAQQAGQAGQALGERLGSTAASGGTQAATQAARTSGVNKGQAAILGGQEAGRAFTSGQTTGQGLGMNAYGQGAANQIGAAQAQGNLGTNQMYGGAQQAQQGNAATGSLLSAVGGLFSDEKVKENVKEGPKLEDILKKIKPVAFQYKPEMEQGQGEHVGVMAQDMEKTPLKENVVDTPAGKMIDTPKQENSNLNLIVQLAARIHELEGQLSKGAK